VFLWMLYVKAYINPAAFSDALVMFVGAVAITGLGLTVVFQHVKELKNVLNDESTRSSNSDSEAPK
jgi:archaellum component FlaG (FlaF/FlaG flagellin family)